MNSGMPSSEIDATRYPDLRKYVVGSLAGHKKPNDIIFELCRRTGWDWNQAKRFVEQVVEMDQKQVHQQRMPLQLVGGIFLMAIGLGLSIVAYVDLFDAISELQNPNFSAILDLIFDLARMSTDPLAFLLRLSIVVGPATFIGGALGIWSSVKSAITGEGEDLMKSGARPQA